MMRNLFRYNKFSIFRNIRFIFLHLFLSLHSILFGTSRASHKFSAKNRSPKASAKPKSPPQTPPEAFPTPFFSLVLIEKLSNSTARMKPKILFDFLTHKVVFFF